MNGQSPSSFIIRISSLIHHSDFVIHHFPRQRHFWNFSENSAIGCETPLIPRFDLSPKGGWPSHSNTRTVRVPCPTLAWACHWFADMRHVTQAFMPTRARDTQPSVRVRASSAPVRNSFRAARDLSPCARLGSYSRLRKCDGNPQPVGLCADRPRQSYTGGGERDGNLIAGRRGHARGRLTVHRESAVGRCGDEGRCVREGHGIG